MNDQLDEALRRRFEAERAADGRSAPPFDAMWRRAVADAAAVPAQRRRIVPLVAAAAVIVVVVGVSVARLRREGATPVVADSADVRTQGAETIGNWHAPTDVLLRYSGSEFLDAPVIGRSAIDRFIPESKLLKGA